MEFFRKSQHRNFPISSNKAFFASIKLIYFSFFFFLSVALFDPGFWSDNKTTLGDDIESSFDWVLMGNCLLVCDKSPSHRDFSFLLFAESKGSVKANKKLRNELENHLKSYKFSSFKSPLSFWFFTTSEWLCRSHVKIVRWKLEASLCRECNIYNVCCLLPVSSSSFFVFLHLNIKI